MVKDRQQGKQKVWSNAQMQPPLADHAAKDHVHVFELNNPLDILIDQSEEIQPVLTLQYSNHCLLSLHLQLPLVYLVTLLAFGWHTQIAQLLAQTDSQKISFFFVQLRHQNVQLDFCPFQIEFVLQKGGNYSGILHEATDDLANPG